MALQELTAKESIAGDEDAISETLCPILTKVCYDLTKLRDIEIRTPVWEGPIQPVADHEFKSGKIKRPDFTCKCVNPWANSAEEHEIPFHVECKRLGNPTSPSWKLNEKYVINGICRFDSMTHEYGKRSSSGLMIGYIISMTPPEILEEVNHYQSRHLPDNVSIIFSFGSGNTWKTRQTMQRKFVKLADFELIHLWVDLCCTYRS